MALKVLDYAGLGRLLAGLEKRYIKDGDTISELTVTNGIDVQGSILTRYLVFPDESYSAFAGGITSFGDGSKNQSTGISLEADNIEFGSLNGLEILKINHLARGITRPSTFEWHAGSATSWADFVLGNVTAHGKIAKAGGKATQFLMADGSIKEQTDLDKRYVTSETFGEFFEDAGIIGSNADGTPVYGIMVKRPMICDGGGIIADAVLAGSIESNCFFSNEHELYPKGTYPLGTSGKRWSNVYANTINVTSAELVSNLNADRLDGYHAGLSNGQIPFYVEFPNYNSLINLGYLGASYPDESHPAEKYLQAICKWAIDTYPTGGLLIGIGTPSSAGNLQIHLYANGKDAETGLPRYCSGVYYGLSGKIYPFRVENYVWYFGCTINANADTATTASMATLLSGGRKINGTSFTNISDITTALWGTARNIYVQDHTGAHYGGAVSVNGSADVRLKLPSVMDLATLNVTTAVWLNGTSAMLRGKGKYGGFNLYAGYSAVANEIFRIDGENPDGTFACNIMKSDINGNVAFGPSNVDAAYRMLVKGNAKVDGDLSTGDLRVTGDVTIDGEAYCTLLGASTVEADSIQTNTLNIGSDGVHYDPQMNAIVFEGNVIINGSFLNG